MKLNDRKYKEFKLELKTDTWKSFITERLFSKFENGKTNQQMLTVVMIVFMWEQNEMINGSCSIVQKMGLS